MAAEPVLRQQIDNAVLNWPRVVAGSAFGSAGYYVKGHAFAFWEGGGLVLKLPAEMRLEALARRGARRYTVPRGSGAEWVLVPVDETASLADLMPLLAAACRFLGGEPP